jgi:hypothetical protein
MGIETHTQNLKRKRKELATAAAILMCVPFLYIDAATG